jgi:hypothetical protein
MNGVSEALLEELLKSNQAQVAILQKLANSFSSTNASSPTAGLAGMSKATTGVNIALNVLQSGFNLLSGLLSRMGSIVGQTIGHFVNLSENLFNFAKQAAYGTAQLSNFIEVFKDLPLVGRAFQLFAGVIRYQEELLGVYRNLSNSGATFGGSLQAMNSAANRAYMSLGEFAKVVGNNSDLFSGLGAGNVDRGIVAFVDANKRLMGPDSEYSQGILGLGVSAEQASEFLTTTMRSQGFKDRQATATADQLAKYTNEYVKTLDEMSRLTGVRRDQLDAEVKKAEGDQLFQTFKDGLDSASSAAVQNMLAMAAPFGTAAVEEVKNRLRGLDTPITEAGTNLAIMSGGASLAGEGLRKALKGTAEEQQAAMSRYLGNIASATGGLVKSVGTVGQAAGVLGNMVPAEFQRISRIMQAGGLTFEQAMKKAAEDSAKAAKGPAGAFAEAQQNVKRFGSNMNEVFMKLIGPLVEPLVKFSGGLLESINTLISSDGFAAVVDKVTKTMTKMIEWAGGAFKKISDAFGDGDWKKAFSEAFKQLKEGLGNIWEVIKPTMVELWNTVLKPAFVGLLDLMWGAFKEWLFGPSAQQLQDQGQQKKEQKVAVRVDEAYYKNQATEQLAGKEGVTTIQINELAKKLKEQAIAENEAEMRRLNARNQAQPPVRHSGTIGMTGNWWEKKDATLAVQAGESVVTKSQMDQIINTASQTGMAESIQQLNSLTAQMLAVMKQTADNTKRTYDATRALNGDLFQVA